jgi:hypothetical protein
VLEPVGWIKIRIIDIDQSEIRGVDAHGSGAVAGVVTVTEARDNALSEPKWRIGALAWITCRPAE